jgi:hypothetical protein
VVVRRAYLFKAPMENASRCNMYQRHNFAFETFPFVAESHDWLRGICDRLSAAQAGSLML